MLGKQKNIQANDSEGEKEEKPEEIEKEPAEENKEQEYLNRWLRCQADFENYRKMQSQLQKDNLSYAISGIAHQILPVLDNFQASIEHIPEDQKESPWVKGIMHIQRQLEQVLKDNGVEEIDVKVGDNFNPEIHEAVHREAGNSEQESENKIAKVIRKGYKIREKIIRAARVAVE